MSKRPRLQYDDSQMHAAIVAVQNGAMSRFKASAHFKVPRATLCDKIAERSPIIRKLGKDPFLSRNEEQSIADWIKRCGKRGSLPQSRDVFNSVQLLFRDESKRKNPFVNSIPGKQWLKAFLSRHKDIIIRGSGRFKKPISGNTESSIRKWFGDLEINIMEVGAEDIFTDPSRVFNASEINVHVCKQTGRVLGISDWKSICELPNSKNNNLTFMGTFNAKGEIVTPAIVFPYVEIPSSIKKRVPVSFFVGGTESGLMEAGLFYDFICKVFHPWIGQENIQRPVILFVDGHKTPITMQVTSFCEDKGIILYLLPPNTEYILQPACMGPFKDIKEYWKTEFDACKNKNFNSVVQRKDIAPMFDNILDKLERSSIMKGFEETGLFPFDVDRVNYSKCAGIKKERFVLDLDYSGANVLDYHITSQTEDSCTTDESSTTVSKLKREPIYQEGTSSDTDQDNMNGHRLDNSIQSDVSDNTINSIPDEYIKHDIDSEMSDSASVNFDCNNINPDSSISVDGPEGNKLEDFDSALKQVGEILGPKKMPLCMKASVLGVSDDLYSLVNDLRNRSVLSPEDNVNTLKVIGNIMDPKKMAVCLAVSELGVSADLYSVVNNIRKKSNANNINSPSKARLQILREGGYDIGDDGALLTHIVMGGDGNNMVTTVTM